MKQTIVLSIYVHKEGYNSYSSEDFIGYKTFNVIKEVNQFILENDFIIEKSYNDNELNLIYYRLKEYTNSNRINECKNLFDKERPEILDKFFKKEEDKKYEKRKKEGFVWCKSYEDMTAEDYKGSLKKLLTDYVKNYISVNPFGYLGHYYRKHSMDKIFEKIAENSYAEASLSYDVSVYECVGIWMCSSSARHWMDSHEDDTDDEFEEAVKKDFKEIVALGFSYKYECKYESVYKLLDVKIL